MKELTIEQKAQRYDEAIERAKAYQGLRSEMEIIFPELKESDDEKTKRVLHSIANKMSQHLRDIFSEEEFQCYDAWSNAWLEKQGEQKPAEWSDDDEKRMNHIIQFLEDKDRWKDSERAFPIEEDIRWLKSLKDRVRLQNGYNPYKEVVESIAEMCEKYKLPTSDLSDFLDNVKVKCKEAKEFDAMFPQSTWKPSDDEMKALANALSLANNCGEEYAFDLRTLQDQLKKLK